MSWLRRLDPLLLFLVIGFGVYLLLNGTGNKSGNERVIEVNRAALEKILATRSGQLRGQGLANLSADERQALIDQYVRDEALFREARALGLDEGDSAIRRRLIQSLQFSLQLPPGGTAQLPSDEQLRAYLADHQQRYLRSVTLTLSQIYFDSQRRGRDGAWQAAQQLLATMNRDEQTDWLALGDRYPYQRSQYQVTETTLAAEWGEAAASQLFGETAPEGRWFGPVLSEQGVHLVRIESRQPAELPAFATLKPLLQAQWLAEAREQALQAAEAAIVARYQVRLAAGIGS
ncbi:peptidylprolyl isomerase [Halioxenophilus sp. WMMB6]|uniref:peptidylprolyl isomerase n=1 Tax=Halioxenophilus sp. WMMB6 TaxID=3073815 RepID=UPI00295E7CF7|nr:peptidylprolyl isomerase [Halioxenophilus sp. WMMB6]